MTTTHCTIGVKTTGVEPINGVRTAARTESARRSSAATQVVLDWEWNDGVDKALVRLRERETGADYEIAAETHLAVEVYYLPLAYRDQARRQWATTGSQKPQGRRRRGWHSSGGSVRGGAES